MKSVRAVHGELIVFQCKTECDRTPRQKEISIRPPNGLLRIIKSLIVTSVPVN